MAYLIETDVDKFGYVHGGDEWVSPLVTAEHPWTLPFPKVPEDLDLVWEPGESNSRPNVFHHNLLRDFACDLPTYDLLRELLRDSLHVVATGHCDRLRLVVLQVVRVFDVVDAERSLPYKYAPNALSYPHIPPDREVVVQGNFFRVPNPGLSLMSFVANDVKEAIERSGITGWRFEPATVSDE
jgi:hypothetical protein